MYIDPNTTIKLLRNVPLDNTYRNTIYFASKAAQQSFFVSKEKYSLDHQSYQRAEKGEAKVQIKTDLLYDCNYMMFQNTAFGTKWFYAFINSVEYINNETTLVRYEIDVMQTWHFEYKLGMSFVEREMCVDDTIGNHLVPEGLEIGEYLYTDLGIPEIFNDYVIDVVATFDTSFNDAAGGYYGGMFSGLLHNTFRNGGQAIDFIEVATSRNLANGIVAVVMIPAAFLYDKSPDPASKPKYYQESFPKAYHGIDGYIPKNNKLYTYPYNTLYVTNNEGNSASYPYEYFSGENATFEITGEMSGTPSAVVYPTEYKKTKKNYNEMMSVSNYPQCAYAIDTYRAWVAQNQASLSWNLAGGAAQLVGGLAWTATVPDPSGMGVGYAFQGARRIADIVRETHQASLQPNQARGNQTGGINLCMKIKGFQFYNAHITQEYARIIDNYFSMFGYKTNLVKIPNRVIRPHWNYVQTINANVTGPVPADDIAKIVGIYDRGITFWRNGNEVGDYTLDNRASDSNMEVRDIGTS